MEPHHWNCIAAALAVFTIIIAAVAVAARAKARDEDLLVAPRPNAPTIPRPIVLNAAPSVDGLTVESCTTRFFLRPGEKKRYCAQDGDRPARCHTQPIAAIVDANEDADTARCDTIEWGFGCDANLLCGLQQAGSNLVSDATAERMREVGCGLDERLSC